MKLVGWDSVEKLQPHTDSQIQRISGLNDIRDKEVRYHPCELPQHVSEARTDIGDSMPTSGIRGSSLLSPAISLPPLRSYLAEHPRRTIAKNEAGYYAKEEGLEFGHTIGIDERSSDYHAINTDETADSPSQTLTFNSNYKYNFGKDQPELGLSYPETFYAKIKEKRENHKNAEKRRRDRMKEALESLSKVLPQGGASNIEGNVSSSPSRIPHEDKAALIQAAVLYIEELQQELKDMKLKLK
ncbi:hypothetical protein EIK77_000916 [Talaromyces pinophilus]|nr:hypothetical protein EIK77_000916 [Talaromyces pinophilus]